MTMSEIGSVQHVLAGRDLETREYFVAFTRARQYALFTIFICMLYFAS